MTRETRVSPVDKSAYDKEGRKVEYIARPVREIRQVNGIDLTGEFIRKAPTR